MAGDSCIWRVTSLGAEGSNNGDKIEFNGGTDPNALSFITNTQFQLISAIGVNERPTQIGDAMQDLGFSTLDVIITGSMKTVTVDDTAAHLLKKWLIEAKTNTTFPKGRFGLRLGDFPTFNLTPTSTRGYLLHDISIVRNGEINKIDFVLKLRYNGDVGSLVSGEYTW